MGDNGVAIVDAQNGIRFLHSNWTVTTLVYNAPSASAAIDGVFGPPTNAEAARIYLPAFFHKLNESHLILVESTGAMKILDFDARIVCTIIGSSGHVCEIISSSIFRFTG